MVFVSLIPIRNVHACLSAEYKILCVITVQHHAQDLYEIMER